MKKKSSLTTYAFYFIVLSPLLLVGCAHYWHDTDEVRAMRIAQDFPKEAQLDYLRCEGKWPNIDCLQESWDKHGHIEVLSPDQSGQWKEIRHYIDAMAMYGAAHHLKAEGYVCNEIRFWERAIFSSNHYAICDCGRRYRMKPDDGSWSVVGIDTHFNKKYMETSK